MRRSRPVSRFVSSGELYDSEGKLVSRGNGVASRQGGGARRPRVQSQPARRAVSTACMRLWTLSLA